MTERDMSAEAIAAMGRHRTTPPKPELVVAAPPAGEPAESSELGLSQDEIRAEIERMIGPGIGGYTVEVDDRRWGPFGTAEEAAQWATENLPVQLATMLKHIDWIIRPFLKAEPPETASH